MTTTRTRTWRTVAPGWENHAACRNEDPELFFPVSYDSPDGKLQIEAARAVCATCPVRRQCLVAALGREGWVRTENRTGIWGGTTPSQRYAFSKAHPQHIKDAA